MKTKHTCDYLVDIQTHTLLLKLRHPLTTTKSLIPLNACMHACIYTCAHMHTHTHVSEHTHACMYKNTVSI